MSRGTQIPDSALHLSWKSDRNKFFYFDTLEVHSLYELENRNTISGPEKFNLNTNHNITIKYNSNRFTNNRVYRWQNVRNNCCANIRFKKYFRPFRKQ